eukprot:7385055-Prymnesium_polylepis.1
MARAAANLTCWSRSLAPRQSSAFGPELVVTTPPEPSSPKKCRSRRVQPARTPETPTEELSSGPAALSCSPPFHPRPPESRLPSPTGCFAPEPPKPPPPKKSPPKPPAPARPSPPARKAPPTPREKPSPRRSEAPRPAPSAP